MDNQFMAMGSCNGTGAAINVCIGWTPRVVFLWNIEDSLQAHAIWHKGMLAESVVDEGIKLYVGTTYIQPGKLTANGISPFAGGIEINYDGVTDIRWENSAGSDIRQVYVDGNWMVPSGGSPAYRCIGDTLCPNPVNGAKVVTPAGFTIGTDADLNASGERLCWLAFR